jgi:hypothetical protein
MQFCAFPSVCSIAQKADIDMFKLRIRCINKTIIGGKCHACSVVLITDTNGSYIFEIIFCYPHARFIIKIASENLHLISGRIRNNGVNVVNESLGEKKTDYPI